MTLELKKVDLPQNSDHLSNEEILMGKKSHPLQTLKTYNPDDFEVFIQEWAFGFLMQKSGSFDSVYRIGSTGDKGRDVVAYVDKEKKLVDYFQCKAYAKALNKSDALPEIAKLLFYAAKGDLIYPQKYYFIAPRNITPALFDFLNGDVELIRKDVLSYCRKNYNSTQEKKDGDRLVKFIESADLSIFDTRPILDIIDEHSETRWHAMRFGGGLKLREVAPKAPVKIKMIESEYLKQLLNVYSDKTGKNISTPSDLKAYTDEQKHLIDQRNAFYSAEHLRMYARETLPPEYEEFEKFKADILTGINSKANGEYIDGIKKIEVVTDRAIELGSTGNLLFNKIQNLDKHGVCHHLVNDNEINWKWKK
jgi:hypothetical protein